MNKSVLCVLLVLVLPLVTMIEASGQGGRRSYGLQKRWRERLLNEADKEIGGARIRLATEAALDKGEKAAKDGDLEALQRAAEEAAASAKPAAAQLAQQDSTREFLDETVKGVSEEAARILSASPDEAADDEKGTPEVLPSPPPPPPSSATVEVDTDPAEKGEETLPKGALPGDEFPNPGLDKEPKALIPVSKPPKDVVGPNATKVEAKGGAFFHASEKIIVFKDDVEVDHMTFDMSCDKLEIFLYNDVSEEDGESVKSANLEAPRGQRRSDIMRAVASGYVVITRASSTGGDQVGKCRTAVYEDATGEVTMRGYPQVQRGSDLIIATDETTVIVFTADGNMFVRGPSETKVMKEASAFDPSRASGS